KYGITDMDWNLLTGNSEEVMKLANEGFNIFAASSPDVPGGFEHSGLFALVDKNGYLRSRRDAYGNPLIYYRGTIKESQVENFEGEQEQISILKEDIKKLLQE
ncbi:MAG: SCO family protein, partial [Flavobacteriaceae bacterium]|nr:SCO family protein [Flavobacteriaceae bacterium]